MIFNIPKFQSLWLVLILPVVYPTRFCLCLRLHFTLQFIIKKICNFTLNSLCVPIIIWKLISNKAFKVFVGRNLLFHRNIAIRQKTYYITFLWIKHHPKPIGNTNQVLFVMYSIILMMFRQWYKHKRKNKEHIWKNLIKC